MATRVAPSDVQNVMDTSLTSAQIQACINVANTIVNNGPALGSPIAGLVTLASGELFNIELYLSCHFVNLRDPSALHEKIGESMQRSYPESVTTAWGKGLYITIWGQQAVAMDRTGRLAAAGKQAASYKSARREDSDFYTPNLTKTTGNTDA